MKSLLTQHAFTVVEAARALRPTESENVHGLFRLGCEPRETPAALRRLAKALEDFDGASRVSRDPVHVLAKTIQYVGNHGLDVVEMARFVRAELPGSPLSAEDAAREALADTDLVPAPGEIAPAPRVVDETVDQTVIRTRSGPPPDNQRAAPDGGRTRWGPSAEGAGDGPEAKKVMAEGAPRRALVAEFRALQARVGALAEVYGVNTQIEALLKDLQNIGTTVRDVGVGVGAVEAIEVDMLVLVMQVSREVSLMETEMGAPAPDADESDDLLPRRP